MKIKYENLEIEFDIAPFLITAASRLNTFRNRGPLGRLNAAITLVSSNLYALQEGTKISTPSGEFIAAPLLKPRPDGSAALIHSGYPVTGALDLLGQVELGHFLGSLRKSFSVAHDSDPNLNLNLNLICFGSPSSNAVSGQVCERLESVLGDYFQWGDGYNSFILGEQRFSLGNEGVVIAYNSPFNQKQNVIVLSGIGPMGTLGCSKLVSNWDQHIISRKQKKAKKFIAAVRYEFTQDGKRNLLLRKFVALD